MTVTEDSRHVCAHVLTFSGRNPELCKNLHSKSVCEPKFEIFEQAFRTVGIIIRTFGAYEHDSLDDEYQWAGFLLAVMAAICCTDFNIAKTAQMRQLFLFFTISGPIRPTVGTIVCLCNL